MAKFAKFENEVVNLDYVTAMEKSEESKEGLMEDGHLAFVISYLIKFHMINGDIHKLRYDSLEEREQEFETIYSILRR